MENQNPSEQNQKQAEMVFSVSRGVKELSPFVYTEILKKLGHRVKDYCVVNISPDKFDRNNVQFVMAEPHEYPVYNVQTATWGDRGEVDVIMVKMEDNHIVMLTFDEMYEIIQKRKAAQPDSLDVPEDEFDMDDQSPFDDMETE